MLGQNWDQFGTNVEWFREYAGTILHTAVANVKQFGDQVGIIWEYNQV